MKQKRKEKTVGILTSSEQLRDELIDCEVWMLNAIEHLVDQIKNNNLEEDFIPMMEAEIERRRKLYDAIDIIEEFENTVPKSKNFTKISSQDLNRLKRAKTKEAKA